MFYYGRGFFIPGFKMLYRKQLCIITTFLSRYLCKLVSK